MTVLFRVGLKSDALIVSSLFDETESQKVVKSGLSLFYCMDAIAGTSCRCCIKKAAIGGQMSTDA